MSCFFSIRRRWCRNRHLRWSPQWLPTRPGTLDFESLLANFQSVLEYEVNYYQELATYQKALVNLEQITGVELAN